jgi:hypothetical protein
VKTCTKCQQSKELDAFVKDKRRSDGRGSWCHECNRAYLREIIKTPKVAASRKRYYENNKDTLLSQAKERWELYKDKYQAAKDKWAEENRDKMLDYYRSRGSEHRSFVDSLKNNPCLDCGETYPPFCMEFDHVEDGKRFNIGKMSNHKRDQVLKEIEKCELVCCACHRVRTQTRKGNTKISKNQQFRDFINGLKNNPCVDCGRIRPAVAMDFDHINGEKVSGVSNMWSWERWKVIAELEKCELVCCICHRIRTVTRLRSKNK